jgi:hypothetical protein
MKKERKRNFLIFNCMDYRIPQSAIHGPAAANRVPIRTPPDL